MMVYLLENIWIWGAFALAIGISGLMIYSSTGSIKAILIAIASSLGVFAVGYVLVFCVSTDRKEIRKTILILADAIVENDIDKVLSHIEPVAESTQAKARYYIGKVKIEWTKIRDFKIDSVNYYTSPPTAHLHFTGTAGGRASNGEIPFVTIIHFTDVEMIKSEDDRWIVTDHCEFRNPSIRGN